MYCRNCGNKLLDTDNFCNKCGIEININQDNNELNQSSNDKINVNLPMNWFNFWKYVRFPLGILVSLYNLFNYINYETSNLILVSLFIDIFIFAFLCMTFSFFINRKKIGIYFINTWLIIELLTNIFNSVVNTYFNSNYISTFTDFIITYVVTIIIVGLIWTLPNYIYFNKRKNYFCK